MSLSAALGFVPEAREMIRHVRRAPRPDAFVVDAPARLHLGFLDPSASMGRRFASLGLVIDGIGTRLEIAAADRNDIVVASDVDAGEAARLQRHLDTLQRRTGRDTPVRVTLLSAPPAHSGFGSGTQLALAIGHAFARFHRIDIGSAALAALLGRGERSGVGIAGFDRGGLLLDGGPGTGGAIAPLLSRIEFPAEWRVVLILDERMDGLSGVAERQAIDTLPPFPRERAADVCHQVLMRVLPGALEHDFAPFADGVSAIQRLVGGHFAPAQGGSMYTSSAVRRAIEWIEQHQCAGTGQSSWGPTGFAIMSSAQEAERAIAGARAAGAVDPALRILVVRGRNHGARVGPASNDAAAGTE